MRQAFAGDSEWMRPLIGGRGIRTRKAGPFPGKTHPHELTADSEIERASGALRHP